MAHALASLAIGVLGAVAVWLVLERSKLRLLYGLLLFSHTANLFLLLTSRWTPTVRPPLIDAAGGVERLADPVPQAFILTAIVIGFAIAGFVVVLMVRLAQDDRQSS